MYIYVYVYVYIYMYMSIYINMDEGGGRPHRCGSSRRRPDPACRAGAGCSSPTRTSARPGAYHLSPDEESLESLEKNRKHH